MRLAPEFSKMSIYEQNCAKMRIPLGDNKAYHMAVSQLLAMLAAASQQQKAQFAQTAPDAPAWYVEPKLEHGPLPQCPNWDELGTKEDQFAAQAWIDGEYELPEHLAWFGKAYTARRNESARRKIMDEQNRLVSWRWHYAELMYAQMVKDAS